MAEIHSIAGQARDPQDTRADLQTIHMRGREIQVYRNTDPHPNGPWEYSIWLESGESDECGWASTSDEAWEKATAYVLGVGSRGVEATETVSLPVRNIQAARDATFEIQLWAEDLRKKSDEFGTLESQILRGMARRMHELTDVVTELLDPDIADPEQLHLHIERIVYVRALSKGSVLS